MTFHDENAQPAVWIGFIAYGEVTARYLGQFLASLAAQQGIASRLIAFDNTPEKDNPNREILDAHPDIEVLHEGENLGFSRAYNKMISRARTAGADYFLVINPDTVVEPDAIKKMVEALEKDERIASAAPKLRKWDFAASVKTSLIDSCGLRLSPGLKFTDLGQGTEDRGQYDAAGVLGPSGAAGLFRLSALQAVAEDGQYFDEHFFMYKEDCDLVYRLSLAGFSSEFVSDALVYHDRSDTGGSLLDRTANRFFARSRNSRRWAFINQHLLFIKFWRRQDAWSKLMVLFQIKLRFFAALILEPYLLKEYRTILSQRKTLRRY